MSKSAEEIYDEVAARWEDDAAERKERRRTRIAEAVLLAVPAIGFVVWSVIGGWSIAIGLAVPFATLAGIQLRKIWRLEDRIRELEKR
jgi:hypothetical protein